MELKENAFQNLRPLQRGVLLALIEHDVSYLVIGGYAMRAHGHLRTSDDLDIVVSYHADNADLVCAALASVGKIQENTRELLGTPNKHLTFCDTEFFTDLNGVTFEELKPRSITVEWKSHKVRVIGAPDLLKAKMCGSEARSKTEKSEVDEEDIQVLKLILETDE